MGKEFTLALFLLFSLPVISSRKGRQLSNDLEDILNESTIEDKVTFIMYIALHISSSLMMRGYTYI